MNLEHITTMPEFKVLCEGDSKREISRVFCCDLLSIAMSKAPCDGVWVTVMGNKNALAVASLTDTACIVLAEGASLDEDTLQKAREEKIAVLTTPLSVFDAALKIHKAGWE